MQEEAIRPIKASVMIANLWLFVDALSSLNAEIQARQQHIPFLSLWYDSARVRTN